ncbi:MAG: hypothetical protein J6P46_00230 [Bacteroidales bacterium]|nr:hypothetical protein [Bacteroidales bacterium]
MKESLFHRLISRLTLPPPDAMTLDDSSITKMRNFWRITKFRQTGAHESAADSRTVLVTVRYGPKYGCGAPTPASERRGTWVGVRQFGEKDCAACILVKSMLSV